jgi:hypothetical protein
MSVTVYPLGGHDGPDINISFHNGFASFLDQVLGGDELPRRFFAQGAATPGPNDPPDPGELSPEDCATFADAIDGLTDENLRERMAGADPQGSAEVNYSAAIKTVREIADLAGLNAGLAVR